MVNCIVGAGDMCIVKGLDGPQGPSRATIEELDDGYLLLRYLSAMHGACNSRSQCSIHIGF